MEHGVPGQNPDFVHLAEMQIDKLSNMLITTKCGLVAFNKEYRFRHAGSQNSELYSIKQYNIAA